MLIDLRLCIGRDKKTGQYWFVREDEREYSRIAGPFETVNAAEEAMDKYNREKNGWPPSSPLLKTVAAISRTVSKSSAEH